MPSMAARTRWLIGGGVAAVAVVVAVGAAILLSARGVPEALKYVPGNAVAVAELRLDLPGDQFQKVGNLLSHFPGFADQSTLPAKLNETLDRLAQGATNGTTDYSTKLKPWLAGPTFAGALPPAGGPAPSAAPVATTPPSGTSAGRPGDYVVVATTDGTVTCATAIQNGTSRAIPEGQLLVAANGDDACFMDGKFGLLGTPAAITAALDAHKAGTGMDRDAQYATARSALAGDRLATAYVSGKAGAALMGTAGASVPPGLSSALPFDLPVGLPAGASLPDWLIAGIRAEDDALVADVIVAPGTGATASSSPAGSPLATLPPPHASTIAGFIPGNTIALVEAHGVGPVAQNALAALQADPQFQSAAGQLNGALAAVGGAGGFVGWISDAGVVVLPQSTTGAAGAAPGVDAGLVLVATDEATATAKVGQLKTLLSFLALSAGGSVTDEAVEGTTITTVDLGDLSTLVGASGAGSQLGGITIPSGLHVKFTVATRGNLVLFGGDESFARDVLGIQAGQTLADDAAYQRSLGRSFAANLGQAYVAGAAARTFAARFLPSNEQSTWQSALPYAAPIDAALLTTTLENGRSHTRIVISVSTPAPAPSGS